MALSMRRWRAFSPAGKHMQEVDTNFQFLFLKIAATPKACGLIPHSAHAKKISTILFGSGIFRCFLLHRGLCAIFEREHLANKLVHLITALDPFFRIGTAMIGIIQRSSNNAVIVDDINFCISHIQSKIPFPICSINNIVFAIIKRLVVLTEHLWFVSALNKCFLHCLKKSISYTRIIYNAYFVSFYLFCRWCYILPN